MTETAEPGLFAAPPLAEQERMIEAMLFASAEPLTLAEMQARMPHGCDAAEAMVLLRRRYDGRGVNVVRVGDGWAFRTAPDLGHLMQRQVVEQRKLSRAAIETLAIVAYHQPVTRAEIEAIRGVTISKGTLDVLIETGWARLRGRRKVPGRPVTYGTTEAFLNHFGLNAIDDLPGLDELKGAGFLEGRLPSGFSVPVPNDDPALHDDEDPLEDSELDLSLAPKAEPEAEAGEEETAERQRNVVTLEKSDDDDDSDDDEDADDEDFDDDNDDDDADEEDDDGNSKKD